MQPYQKAAEAIRSGEEYPIQILKNSGLTALGGGAAAAGSKALSRLVPAIGALINEYVPDNISMAGLGKIDPRFNKFIQGAISEGYTYEDVRNFLGDKIKTSETQEHRNIIEQYSPELHQLIDQHIRSGRRPIEAAAIAQADRRHEQTIKKLSKDHKMPWSKIVESVYGGALQESQPQQAPMQDTQQQQPGQGQAALMAILQKLQQARGSQ